MSAFFRNGAEENAIPTVIMFLLSERNSTLLKMSPGHIDRAAAYGFATSFKVDTIGCVLASSLMIAEFKTVMYFLA